MVLVHGGAGDVAPQVRPARVEGCKRAAAEAAKVLAEGGTALNAVIGKRGVAPILRVASRHVATEAVGILCRVGIGERRRVAG